MASGVKFTFAGSRFTLGATLSFGGDRRPSGALIAPPEELTGSDIGPAVELDVKYRRVVVLLGFLFGR